MDKDGHAPDVNRDPRTGSPAQAVQHGVGVIVAGAAARGEEPRAAEPTHGAAVGGSGAGAADESLPARELAYWSEHYAAREYVEPGASFDDYGPAYGLGAEARARHPGRDFDDVEAEMACDWAARRGVSTLHWDRARHAARDAWYRIDPAARQPA